MHRPTLLALLLALVFTVASQAVTPLPSEDGQFWDIQDTSPWAQDSGGIATGGRANPFNGFGYLKLQSARAGGPPVLRNQYLKGFGLAHDGGERLDSLTPALHDGVVVARAIYAPRDTNYLRYLDTFFNSTDEPRTVRVAWGGATGAFEDGGRVTVATTSSGDRRIDPQRSVRHGDAERTQRGGSDAGPIGPWPLGARPRHQAGRADRRRGHVRRSLRGRVSRLRPGAHRLRLHADSRARPDGRAHDVRREGPERGLRPAGRLSGCHARRLALDVVRPGVRRRGPQGAGAGQRDRASHGGRAPTRGSARPARPHAAPASADRQLEPRAAAAACVRSPCSRRPSPISRTR